MKAAQINDYGGEDVLNITDSAPKPEAGQGDVLVEVNSSSINPFDWKVREGYLKEYIPLKMPATLGGDASGIVAELGKGVSGFEVGQSVFGMANPAGGQGSFAEFTVIKANQLIAKPQSLDYNQAAAIPLAGASAYQALVESMNLQTGQKILIHGGAGGIGIFAIQIAKHLGTYIATTVSSNDLDFVKSLGADEVIDYQTQDFTTIVKDYDAVFDTVGEETNKKSYQVLKPGGILVSMVAQPNEEAAKSSDIQYVYQSSKATNERLSKIVELVDSGDVKVYIDKTFPLSEADAALEYQKSGHPRGKVVLEIK